MKIILRVPESFALFVEGLILLALGWLSLTLAFLW